MKQDVVQSVDRSFSILEAIADGKKNLLDIAQAVQLNKSTVHRLLQTLIYKGYVSQNEESSQYTLTTKVLHLGQKIIDDLDIIKIAKPQLNELNELTGEVVHLVMIEGVEAIYIDKMEARSNIRMYSYIGKSIPLFSSAVGKAYLAFSNQSIIDQQWPSMFSNVERFTEFTLIDESDLKEDLVRTRARGYAIDREENELGVICVAAPIYNHLGRIQYAISISTPKFRLDENKIDKFGTAVKKATIAISKKLGYQF